MRQLIFGLIVFGLNIGAYAKGGDSTLPSPFVATFNTLVDERGGMSLPPNFQTKWVFLGTWSVAVKDVERSSEASGHGAAGLHNVYTQPGVVEYYLEHKTFPVLRGGR